MCGIAAIIERDPARVTPEADIAAMVQALWHRGPDEEGRVCLPGAALGMRRLAIVDLATGQQPISNEAGDVHIVANGEIYNFLELRHELEALGHRFKTRSSDIESLLHAYEAWGEAFPSRVRGMFAVVIWDARTRTLFAARDRAGEKPLYWTSTSRGLLFASELKALLTRPEVSRTLDVEALDQFLTFEYVMAPRTMFEGVHALPAGSWLRARNGGITVQRYWDPANIPVRAWNDDDAADAVRETLQRAVTSQLMSEVPLGAFLSGGIDSSTLVALMSQGAEPARAHLQHGLRGRHVQRAAVRPRGGNALPDGSYRAARHRRSARSLRAAGAAFRRAVRRRLVLPDVSRVAGGSRRRDRGAQRRRRRRAVRRLRHV